MNCVCAMEGPCRVSHIVGSSTIEPSHAPALPPAPQPPGWNDVEQLRQHERPVPRLAAARRPGGGQAAGVHLQRGHQAGSGRDDHDPYRLPARGDGGPGRQCRRDPCRAHHHGPAAATPGLCHRVHRRVQRQCRIRPGRDQNLRRIPRQCAVLLRPQPGRGKSHWHARQRPTRRQ